MPRFNHRRRSSRRKPELPRAEAERRLRRRRVQGIFQGWGRPTPPTVREVQRIVAKSNSSRSQSTQRRRQKEATGAAFRRTKSRRREYWRRRLGQAPEMGMGGSSAATTTQTPNVIPAQERRANGLASRGPYVRPNPGNCFPGLCERDGRITAQPPRTIALALTRPLQIHRR